jgi:hypothetical protein
LRNRGELPEGWYDPVTLEKANKSHTDPPISDVDKRKDAGEENADSEDDEIGPALPSKLRAPGPIIPSREDLEFRDG